MTGLLPYSAVNPEASRHLLRISLAEQRLELLTEGELVLSYRVSTAAKGAGEDNGSGCTPRGWHEVRAKIGADCPPNTVFVGRRPTGERYTAALAQRYPERDWILTRILWLRGLERGRNRMGQVDSMRRFIYLHGCPDSEPMGVARSHGCIRLRNRDIMELFDRVLPTTRVWIQAPALDSHSPRSARI